MTAFIGCLGTKKGMMQIFREDGRSMATTVLEAGPCSVVQVKTPEKDGYMALQVGYGGVKSKHLSKPLLGYFAKAASEPKRWLREFRVESLEGFAPGQTLTLDSFTPGDCVHVRAMSKGKGFAGVVKRHGFSGGPRSHGQSDRLRAPGSIGGQRPQRVLRGKRMAGRMGHTWITIRNLEVLRVDPEKHLMWVVGAVPGPAGGLVEITKSHKKIVHHVAPAPSVTAKETKKGETKKKPTSPAPEGAAKKP